MPVSTSATAGERANDRVAPPRRRERAPRRPGLLSGRSIGSLPALAAIAASACLLPSDESDSLTVVLDSIPELIAGDVAKLRATINRSGGGQIPNATFRFASDDPNVLAVSTSGEARALRRGTSIVTAEAVDFDGATADARLIAVQGAVQIDSIVPASPNVGMLVAIFGIGLVDSVFGFAGAAADSVLGPLDPAAGLVGDAPDSSFTFFPPLLTVGGAVAAVAGYHADGERHFGRGVLLAWVPRATGQPTVRARTLRGEATFGPSAQFLVDPRDVLEPNDAAPLDLGADPSLFLPALSLEAGEADWFVVRTSGGPRTVVFRWPGVGADSVFVGSGIVFNASTGSYSAGAGAWHTGTGYACEGIPFRPPLRARRDSLVVPLRSGPAAYHVIAFTGLPTGYSLDVRDGASRAAMADAMEPNDACPFAASLPTQTGTFDLTIDEPGDVDWFRFTVAPGDTGDVIVRTTSDAPAADLDLYLLENLAPDSLPILQAGTARDQATDVLLHSIGPGDYYLVVVDFAAAATPYRMELTFSGSFSIRATESRHVDRAR